ncbi:MAG: hypothetical protein JSS20_00225 [Proteobacteria bacterium]|nr:hypothetical protein [Pseudomonadota bacterium]
MQANWQSPSASLGLSVCQLANADAISRGSAPARKPNRDRFDYWLIFAVTFSVFLWLGLIQRINPMFWLSGRKTTGSFWKQVTRGAHHYATMAFQG